MNIFKRKNNERGFISVESITNVLFYMLMVGTAAFGAGQLLGGGGAGGGGGGVGMAGNLSSLSVLRINAQYMAVSTGSFTGINAAGLETLAPGFITQSDKNGDSTVSAPGFGQLPNGAVISADVSKPGHPKPGTGDAMTAGEASKAIIIVIPTSSYSDCRQYAYYGLAADYGVATVLDAGVIDANVLRVENDDPAATLSAACGAIDLPATEGAVVLTSF